MTEREKFLAWAKAGHWMVNESMWAAWEAGAASVAEVATQKEPEPRSLPPGPKPVPRNNWPEEVG
jgi:hypothetical protein